MPQNATNGNLMIMTVTKALVVLIFVGTVAYCTIQQIPFDNTIVTILVGVLGVKEAVSAAIYFDTARHK